MQKSRTQFEKPISGPKRIDEGDPSKSPTESQENFANENKHYNSCGRSISDADVKHKIDDVTETESESEIDLTSTESPKNLVFVNGCIDFSNNNLNKGSK